MSNVKEYITFGTLRKYISCIDRLSICMEATVTYENYMRIRDVPDSYDNLYVYGIGMIESEFYLADKFEYSVVGESKDFVLASCIEIVLSKEPRTDIAGW